MPLGLGRRRRPLGISSPNAPATLTASGVKVTRRNAEQVRRLTQVWQDRSFSYYNLLGEIHYAAQFYSRALSQLELFAAEIVPGKDGAAPEIKPTNEPAAIAALARIQDPGGGRSGLLGAYGRLMFLAGEAFLFVSIDPETEMEQWEMLSTREIRPMDGGYTRNRGPGVMIEDYREPKDEDWAPVDDDTAVAYRLWQRHPEFSELADSTMRGVLDLCEELVLLTLAVRARTRSRLAGPGILLIDERIAGPQPPDSGKDEDPVEDPFMARLIESIMTAINDEGSASAAVPILIRAQVPDGMKIEDLVKHIQITDPTQLYPETGLRQECIGRIAIGLDMPAEILTGMAAVNHWGSWQIDENSWKAHLQPKAQQLVDDLTASYYRPQLRKEGIQDPERFCIGYDPSKVINHPDRGKDANEAYDRVAIGKRAYRTAKGFDEADAPTEEERAERIGILTRDATLAMTGEPAPKPPEGSAPPPEPEDEGGGPAAVEPGPPSTEEEVVTASANGNGRVPVARILGAADVAVYRCREAAGNKLRSLAKRNPEAHKKLTGVPVGETAARLGRELVLALGAPAERELVAAAGDVIPQALHAFGIKDDAVARLVVDSIERHAVRTLYDERPAPLPVSFVNYLQTLGH